MFRSLFRFIVVLAPVLAAIAWGSVGILENLQQSWIERDLARRSALIFGSLEDALEQSLSTGNSTATKRVLNRISRDELLQGVLVCAEMRNPKGAKSSVAIANDKLNPALTCEDLSKTEVMSTIRLGSSSLFVWKFPLQNHPERSGSVYVVNDATVWIQRNENTRVYIFAFFVALAFVIVLASAAASRWTIVRPMKDLAVVLRDVVVSGNAKSRLKRLAKTEFAPLIRDLMQVTQEVQRLRGASTSYATGGWTAERLRSYVKKVLGDRPLCVIANREPYMHNRDKEGKIQILRPASGLVTGVEPILKACNGTWIAHGSGSADREVVNSQNCIPVPPESPEYTLRRVWLTPEEEEGYYYGFSNEGLWPLCHIAHQRPRFDSSDWEAYIAANKKFAAEFAKQYGNQHVLVLIQDYHFSLLPKLIREVSPNAIIALFWHIPWPNAEAFGICPWRSEILDAMLSADVLGFHTQFHCNNFIESVDRYVESRIDRELFTVKYQGHECRIRTFPISIPMDEHSKRINSLNVREAHNLAPNTIVTLGVDRVDYTKGIIERVRGIARFAERRPDLAKNFSFIQIGAPSRVHIPVYRQLNDDVGRVVTETNEKFRELLGRDLIILKLKHHNPEELIPFYEQANIALVTPLHDGMNLVTKEFVAARHNEDGVLILSQFAGASRELREALIINPYGPDDIASKLIQACEMTAEEQRDRMRRMRRTVKEFNVYKWAYSQLNELHDVYQMTSIGLDQNT